MPRKELPEFLKALANYKAKGRLLMQLSIELLILTFVRPGELRGARWEEFDLEERIWRIPAERMKMGTEHLVPLAHQTVTILKKIHEISVGYPLLFPPEKKPRSLRV
ncbi:tyrosine-type recombinase/integrase [Sessilibacter sp. MAH4]